MPDLNHQHIYSVIDKAICTLGLFGLGSIGFNIANNIGIRTSGLLVTSALIGVCGAALGYYFGHGTWRSYRIEKEKFETLKPSRFELTRLHNNFEEIIEDCETSLSKITINSFRKLAFVTSIKNGDMPSYESYTELYDFIDNTEKNFCRQLYSELKSTLGEAEFEKEWKKPVSIFISTMTALTFLPLAYSIIDRIIPDSPKQSWVERVSNSGRTLER